MRIEDEIIDLGDHQLLLRNAVEEDAAGMLKNNVRRDQVSCERTGRDRFNAGGRAKIHT